MTVREFRKQIQLSTDPITQYYTVLSKYERGKMDTAQLRRMALDYARSGNELPWKLASEYFSKIPESYLGSKDAISLMMKFPESPEIQRYAIKYLTKVPAERYKESQIKDMFYQYAKSPEVVNAMLQKLRKFGKEQLKDKISLLNIYKNIPEAKKNCRQIHKESY